VRCIHIGRRERHRESLQLGVGHDSQSLAKLQVTSDWLDTVIQASGRQIGWKCADCPGRPEFVALRIIVGDFDCRSRSFCRGRDGRGFEPFICRVRFLIEAVGFPAQ